MFVFFYIYVMHDFAEKNLAKRKGVKSSIFGLSMFWGFFHAMYDFAEKNLGKMKVVNRFGFFGNFFSPRVNSLRLNYPKPVFGHLGTYC